MGLTPKRELPQHFPVYFGAFVVGEAPYRLLTRSARQKDLAAHGSLPRSDLLSISSHINRLLEAVPFFRKITDRRPGKPCVCESGGFPQVTRPAGG